MPADSMELCSQLTCPPSSFRSWWPLPASSKALSSRPVSSWSPPSPVTLSAAPSGVFCWILHVPLAPTAQTLCFFRKDSQAPLLGRNPWPRLTQISHRVPLCWCLGQTFQFLPCRQLVCWPSGHLAPVTLSCCHPSDTKPVRSHTHSAEESRLSLSPSPRHAGHPPSRPRPPGGPLPGLSMALLTACPARPTPAWSLRALRMSACHRSAQARTFPVNLQECVRVSPGLQSHTCGTCSHFQGSPLRTHSNTPGCLHFK